MPSEAEIAWAAGLFEGEGTFTLTKSRGDQCQMVASLASTDRDVVERFAGLMAVGGVSSTHFTVTGKQVWRWGCVGKSVLVVMEMLLPWLGSRRTERAAEVRAARYAWEMEHPLAKRTIIYSP